MSNLLAGQWVLVTGVKTAEREEVARNVELCGGVCLSSFSTKDPPHLVVTRIVRSPKYRALLRAHPHTPVVTPDWLAASLQADRLLPYTDYRVGPLHALTVCFSGLAASRKAALAGLVVRAGGQHSSHLDRKCTHLVTLSTDSDKYRFAAENSIVSVTPLWVEHTLEAGWCQDEEPYLVAQQPVAPQPAAATKAALPAAAAAAARSFDTAGAEVAAEMPMPLLDHASRAGAACAVSGEALADAPMQKQQQQQQQQQQQGAAGLPLPPARAPSRLQRGSSMPLQPAAAAEPLSAAVPAVPLRRPPQQQLDEQLDWDDGIPPFLDAVRLRLVGCSQAEAQEGLQLVRQSAAKRFSDWRSDINHVVVGSELSAGEAAEALDFLSTHRLCFPVTLEWLRQSVAAQKRLRPDGFFVPFSKIAQHRRKPPLAQEQAEAAARLERSRSVGGEPAAGGGSIGDLGRTHSVAPAGPLAGCYFTLAAVRGTEDEQRASQLIREGGGRLFTETTLQRVGDKSKAYALCPHSLVAQQVTQLRSACPDFKLVDERRRFTLFWLECSIEAGEPLPINRGAPLYQPLPFPLPMPSMADVSVAISGYDEAVRGAITRTVETFGGRVSAASMTRHNTHLILPQACGKKYQFCGPFGVTPVTAEWLVDTAQVGRRQPETNYYPPPPPGQHAQQETAAGVAAARMAVAVAALRDGGGGTQVIGGTQAGTQQHGGGRQQRPQQRSQQLGAAGPSGAALGSRPQLVLPPPPGQQQQQQQQQQQPWQQQFQPQPQPTQQPGTGGKLTLRERMRATKAAAAVAAAPAAAAAAASAAPFDEALLRGNNENSSQENNPSSTAADVLTLGAGKPLTTSIPQHQQPHQQHQQPPQQQRAASTAAAFPAPMQPLQRQPSALDQAMASLDQGLRQLAQQPPEIGQQHGQQVGQQQQQQQQVAEQPSAEQLQPATSSMFEALFGSDPVLPAAAAAAGSLGSAAAASAAPAAADAGPASADGAPARASAAPVAAAGVVAGQEQPGAVAGEAGSSAQGRRTSSRLRAAGQAAAPALLGEPHAAPQGAGQQPAAAAAQPTAPPPVLPAGGSERQDDFGRAVDMLGEIMDGMPSHALANASLMAGTQLDIPAVMMPPPARGRGGATKRSAATPADSGVSDGSAGGSRGGRAAKRQLADADAVSGCSSGRVQQLRRSGRGAKAGGELHGAGPHFEMSQQVGYAENEYGSAHQPRATSRQGKPQDKQLLKRQLVETAGRQMRRGGGDGGGGGDSSSGAPADPLASLL